MLKLIAAEPGITIPALGEKMGVKGNYLYTVVPSLERAAKVRKDGRPRRPHPSRRRGWEQSLEQQSYSFTNCRLSRVVEGVVAAAARSPLRMELTDLLRWHTGIFKTTFPQEAGQLRNTETQFGVRWREDGELHQRAMTGSASAAIRAELLIARMQASGNPATEE